MTAQFIAIDVETANNERGSICQIGLAEFDGRGVTWEWSSLVNPEQDFDDFNVGIHGIGSLDVRAAPTWPSILAAIAERIREQTIVSHTRFDRDNLHHATQRYGLSLPVSNWLDTCAIARLAWPSLPGHDLQSLCQRFGIQLKHHCAASDARAAGEVLVRAITDSGLGVADWITRAGLMAPSSRRAGGSRKRYSERIEAKGAPGGRLAGHVWVCTGEFSIGEAALVEMAASLGCDVKESFTKKTTMLVLGHRDPAYFAGKEKSRKQLQAEAAIAEGRKIAVMTEREFLDLADNCKSVSKPSRVDA